MQVLFLCHRIPYPPDKGDKIRSYHLLTFLARRGDVDVVTHADDPRDLRHVHTLEDMSRSVSVFPLNPLVSRFRALSALPGGRPLSVAFMTRAGAGRRVRELLATHAYDLVVGYSSQVAAYLPEDLKVPVVLDLVDVDSEKFVAYAESRRGVSGAVSRLEARRLRTFERRVADRAARVVLTTPREVELFKSMVGGDAVAIGNGVVLPDAVRPHRERDDGLVVFLGTMDYEPNVEAVAYAAERVLPVVRQRHPDARLRIIGRNPTRRVRDLAARDGVEVTGEVPDLREHLEAASVSLVPLRIARGIQNKVLEALAYGVPVVATHSVRSCLHDDVSDAVAAEASPERMAARVSALIADPGERQRLADLGRAYVARHHDWSRLDAEWGSLFEEVIARSVTRTP